MYKDQMKASFTHCCCVYPTAPFVNKEILNNSYLKFNNSTFDSLIPVVEFSYPPQRGLVIIDDLIKFVDDRFELSRSQDLEKIYHDVGQFYWIRVDEIISQKKLFTNNSTFMRLNPLFVQDIDNVSDWEMAEFKYRFLKSKVSQLN